MGRLVLTRAMMQGIFESRAAKKQKKNTARELRIRNSTPSTWTERLRLLSLFQACSGITGGQSIESSKNASGERTYKIAK